jgi:hypothetical protein
MIIWTQLFLFFRGSMCEVAMLAKPIFRENKTFRNLKRREIDDYECF